MDRSGGKTRPTRYEEPIIKRAPAPRLFQDITAKPLVQVAPAKQPTDSVALRTDGPAGVTKPQLAPMRPADLDVPRQTSASSKTVPTKRHLKSRLNKSALFMIMAIALFTFGLYISWQSWRANNAAQAQAAYLTRAANNKEANSNSAPSTVKPSATTISSYVVAPNLPRYIIIPKLSVYARILSVSVNAEGVLGAPNNIYDTAWYNESAEPSQPGAMLIDGHISSWTAHGVFYGLNKLVAGDSIQIVRGDGTTFSYHVVSSEIYSSNNVDMAAAITAINPSKPGLNLISCTGDVIPGTSKFNERIIVFASQD